MGILVEFIIKIYILLKRKSQSIAYIVKWKGPQQIKIESNDYLAEIGHLSTII